MIKKKKVKVFEERLYCDECGEEMKYTGETYLTCPQQHSYCCKIGLEGDDKHEKLVKEHYPRIVYEEVEDDDQKGSY